MYRASPRGQLEFPNFYLPFAGRLDPNIRYPTDVSLLNEAREKTEELIDELQMYETKTHRRSHAAD